MCISSNSVYNKSDQCDHAYIAIKAMATGHNLYISEYTIC